MKKIGGIFYDRFRVWDYWRRKQDVRYLLQEKISDLQRRLDAQYDRIDEVEKTMAELKSQVYEFKENQIDADSIYRFLGTFNEIYLECTDVEKK